MASLLPAEALLVGFLVGEDFLPEAVEEERDGRLGVFIVPAIVSSYQSTVVTNGGRCIRRVNFVSGR